MIYGSPYLEVHVRLFCKNSPERTAEIKVKRKRGSNFDVDLKAREDVGADASLQENRDGCQPVLGSRV